MAIVTASAAAMVIAGYAMFVRAPGDAAAQPAPTQPQRELTTLLTTAPFAIALSTHQSQ